MVASIFLTTLLTGCAARHPGDAVASIHFVGNSGFLPSDNDRVLRNSIGHPLPRWQSFLVPGLIEPAWLDRDTLDRDAWRIEVWYANHGYFDARFLGWEIRGRGPAAASFSGKRLRPVHVIGHLDRGEASKVRAVTLEGIEKLGRPLQRRIEDLLEVKRDAVFETDAYTSSIDAVRAVLLDQSYAHATVEGDVVVHAPEHVVDVTLRIAPGPPARFGDITIEGLQKVPERTVREVLEVVTGDAFKARTLENTRAKLYALRVFSVVNIVPDLSDPTSTVIPIRIQVTETKFRELRAGPEFEAETGKLSLQAHATWSDNNVAGRLWRMEQDTQVGAAVLTGLQDVSELSTADIRPIADVKGTVELPRLFGSNWTLSNEGRVLVALEPASWYFRPSFTPAVLYNGIRHLTVSNSYRIQYTYPLGPGSSTAADASSATDEADDYFISAFEQRLIWDGRNDLIAPSRGWYGSFGIGEAGGPLGGDFTFLKGSAEARAYRGVVRIGEWDPNLVFAARVGGAVILPIGEEEPLPAPERLYLGGSTTVRGWAAKSLGPPLVDGLPPGGNLSLYGNFEMRKGLPLDLTLATFVDVGQVWPEWMDFSAGDLRFTVGAGLRYATPIGPVRFDYGYRLGDDAKWWDLWNRGAFHLALAEAF